MYLSGKEYDQIDREVFFLYEDYLLQSFPIDVIKLAAEMRIKLIPYSTLSEKDRELLLQDKETEDGFHTADIRNGYPKYTIWYNDLDQETRWRHTIAHEIGHIVLHHGSKTTRRQEAAADYFAKQLLAPTSILILRGIDTISETASLFKISIESASYTWRACKKRRERFGDTFMEHEADFIEWVRGWSPS